LNKYEQCGTLRGVALLFASRGYIIGEALIIADKRGR
jgi:hypothetical protein